MDDRILYHGSRGGIDGKIQPISRTRCDFGKGFYMGKNAEQVQSLVVEDAVPVFYTVKFRLSEIPEDKILVVNNQDWLNIILANRKKSEEFNKLSFTKKLLKQLDKYDVIIGPIADDRMNEALIRFNNYALTDKGLYACLKSVDYGNQFVAKTSFACSKIDIISERNIDEQEVEYLRKYTETKRAASRDVVFNNIIKYQRDGLYLNELINKYKKKEKEEYER